MPRNQNACRRCAAPLRETGDIDCAKCQLEPPPFCKAVAPLMYEFPVDMAIKSLKFRRNLYYLPVFGEMLLPELGHRLADADGLAPMPPAAPGRQGIHKP